MMSLNGNLLQNNTLAALSARAPQNILGAIQKASAKTGVDFAYLLEKADAESNFDAAAKAKTGSATGLFQFIEKTWLSMVKNYGHKYGLGEFAEKIDARSRVSDKLLRREILDLRTDPEISSYMAAEFASENENYLKRHVGGEIGSTELYFAHFMGAGGAAAFLKEMKNNPMATAADIFPKEARANRGVFYDPKTGNPRTLKQVYDFFDRKFSGQETGSYIPTVQAEKAEAYKVAAAPDMARKRGYQHIPPSLQQPVRLVSSTNFRTRSLSSLAALLSEDQAPRLSRLNTAAAGTGFPRPCTAACP